MSNKVRYALAGMGLSAVALVAMLSDEGYSEKAYPDPVHGAKIQTIGFGTTDGVKAGDTTTPVQAMQRALRDVQKFEGALKECVTVPLSQGEYDAYVDLSYNIGSGAFCGSTLVRKLNAGDYDGACKQILVWRYAGGQDCSAPGNKTCSGIWRRRLREYQRCING